MLDGLDPTVARAFERSLTALRAAGARIDEIPLGEVAELAGIQATGGFSAAESYAWHRDCWPRGPTTTTHAWPPASSEAPP
jgi:aspartyl-tRNA(Asn)/glutamyl-tRNA(Gln) amidotransferase subunit A